ncbi:translation initiation factor IF-2 [Streptomyces sp. NPDC085995]|uniref:translation initiation factor IF-2 n=1 Tax=Streptomyces sp. NPDC085995 TaxID=3154861 RepID=UPI00344730A8
MSHEQMLAWLDQANSGEVQAAASRLATAATEIQKIGEQLKVRPQVVEWKGEGAEAFRSWANELANSTLRLADFSKAAGEQLGHVSTAIATAQASIPRDTKGAQANLDAATAAHNDPDAAAIRAKSAGELAALKANQEKVRQEAADQMRKLAQSYQASSTHMNALERPKFPPPPTAIAPPTPIEQNEDLARPGTSAPHGTGGGSAGSGPAGAVGSTRTEHKDVVTKDVVTSGSRVHPDVATSGGSTPHPSNPPTITPDAHVGIDTVSAPPEVHQRSTGPVAGPPTTTRPETGPVLPTTVSVPPMPRGPVRLPSASGGSEGPLGRGRLPVQAGEGPLGRTVGRAVTGGSPAPVPGRNLPTSGEPIGRAVSGGQAPTSGRGGTANSGIVGGRPSAPSGTGKSMGRVPGASFGGEQAAGRGAAERASNTGATGQPANRAAGHGGGRSAATPRAGIVGGTPQKTGRGPARPGAPVPSAPTRGGISGGVPSKATRGGVRGASSRSTGGAQQRKDKRRNDRRDEPPTTD